MAIAIDRRSLEPWQDPKAQPYVRIERVTKKFGDVYAVDDVSLSIFQGEFFSLLGSSGCGKTTLLRILAGLEYPSSGRIFIDGADVTDLPPYNRPVNMMFQSYALFPHMTVEQNVEFGLKQERMPRRERAERVAEMLDLLKIGELRRRRPDQLSGGQRQRVALARSLAKHPKLLLLDEPLGALDKRLRENTQFELVNLQERIGTTFITVTHDQEEAMTMSTRLAVMDAGQIVQVDTPTGIYEYPNCRFVARFIGSVNLFEGKVVERDGDEVLVETPLGRPMRMRCPQPLALGSPVTVAVRPEKVRLCAAFREEAVNQIRGLVEDIAYLGDVSIYHVRVSPGQIVEMTLANIQPRTEQALTWGQEVAMEWSPTSGVVLAD
ncbi:ABC transporter ATP-binding protein [Thiococcus pfennigii]|jgi:putrescine transport system ATP-binding protein|uniref:ABC transporter ATP-binding protein n=1 Tax=Thiococcus pfennigii TaxID=1057 RepID=UPI0019068992|nr:polyamine ABC transporter ATP-binding protein [Thiococcus pfennigii]MBK1700400.1 polyamine ABC transporter ATP-binding protein [Thiococcus pfennigii]MBK1731617.1 polyamine ABC transporter ATP-binding protein [Thiococcus pfennigii]